MATHNVIVVRIFGGRGVWPPRDVRLPFGRLRGNNHSPGRLYRAGLPGCRGDGGRVRSGRRQTKDAHFDVEPDMIIYAEQDARGTWILESSLFFHRRRAMPRQELEHDLRGAAGGNIGAGRDGRTAIGVSVQNHDVVRARSLIEADLLRGR